MTKEEKAKRAELRLAGLKQCSRCKQVKTLPEFRRQNSGCRYSPRCRSCSVQAVKYRYRTDLEYRKKLKAKAFLKTYTVTEEERDLLIERQGGLCGLCGGSPGNLGLVLDHAHGHHAKYEQACKDCIRGAVCNFCNIRVIPTIERTPQLQNEWAMRYLNSRPFADNTACKDSVENIG